MSHEIEAVEVELSQAKELVEKRDKALKLASNREFRSLVLEGYCKEEVLRLGRVLSDPSPHAQARRDETILELQAVGKFQQYMQTIIQMGNVAAESIEEYEAELAALHQELAE